MFSFFKKNKVKTPTLFQMEIVECGAVALAIILAYYKRFISIEELRQDCGVSRDGCVAGHIIQAASKHGLEAEGFEVDFSGFESSDLPFIAHWRFSHFIVVEGFDDKFVYINDPELGHRKLPIEKFDNEFSKFIITFKKTSKFKKHGKSQSLLFQIKKKVEKEYKAILFLLFAGIGMAILGVIPPILGKIFVDSYLIEHNISAFRTIILALAVTTILSLILSYIQNLFTTKLENKLTIDNSQNILWHIICLPLNFFYQRYVGDISARLESIRTTLSSMTDFIVNFVLQIILTFAYLFLLFYFDYGLALIILFLSILNIFVLYHIAEIKKEKSLQLSVELGQHYSHCFSGFKIMESIKASGSEQEIFSRIVGSQTNVSNTIHEIVEKSIFYSVIPGVLTSISSIVVLLVGTLKIMHGEMSVGTLVAMQTIVFNFMEPLNLLIGLTGQLQEMAGSLAKINDVYNYKVDPQINMTHFTSSEKLMLEENVKLSGRIEMKNVSFRFNTLRPPIVKEINLVIHPGEHIAFVGASGSGKSTIAKMIANLISPSEGEIIMDGKKISEINRMILANSIAIVEQDSMLFNGTLRDNFTIWDNTKTDSEIIQAAKEACIHEEISCRKNGYEARINEGGMNFSGGQRQRIDIARALLSDPRILILDEATSELDPYVENIIYDNIRMRGCTTIIVAHRLTTICNADKIVVLEKGKIVQVGSHEELKSISGYYRKLMEAT